MAFAAFNLGNSGKTVMNLSLFALSLIVAAPAGAQQEAKPDATVAPTAQDLPDAATTSLNNRVQAQLDAVALQNKQKEDAYALQLAAFKQKQAEFERAKAANDNERAAAAVSASDYQKNLATWQAVTSLMASSKKTAVASQAAKAMPIDTVTTGKPRRICKDESTIGTRITTKHCYTIDEANAADAQAARGNESYGTALRMANSGVITGPK